MNTASSINDLIRIVGERPMHMQGRPRRGVVDINNLNICEGLKGGGEGVSHLNFNKTATLLGAYFPLTPTKYVTVQFPFELTTSTYVPA